MDILYCYDNSLTSLDVTNNVNLTQLYCQNNSLTSLDVTQNTALTGLRCRVNPLTSLDVSANTALIELRCANNQLTSLDVTNNVNLTQLLCDNNSLNTLDVSANTALDILYCYDNSLNSLDVSACPLTDLRCYDNNISGGTGSQIVTNWTDSFAGTFSADPQTGGVGGFSVPPVLEIYGVGNFCQVADASAVAHFYASYSTSIPTGSSYFYDPLSTTHVPDAQFYQYLSFFLGPGAVESPNYLYDASINIITTMNLSNSGISNLTGLEGFTALEVLSTQGNSLGTIDVTAK